MEPLTTASAFASIVGLLAIFKSEQRAEESETVEQYVDWLRRQEHEQLATLIQNNTLLSKSLQALLSQQHDEVMSKLHALDQVLSDVARHVKGFQEIAEAVTVQTFLSDQAVSILRQINEANSSKLIEIKTLSGTTYQTLDGQKMVLTIGDPRFIEDDLNTLCELGLLRMDFGGAGSRLFLITRAGASVGE